MEASLGNTKVFGGRLWTFGMHMRDSQVTVGRGPTEAFAESEGE